MHDTWYETLIGAQRGLASRRTAVRSTALRLAAALGIGGLATADAKKGKNKKKKCKKPKIKCKKKCCAAGQVCASGKCTMPPPAEECQFSKTATLWTLQSNCTISKTIEIPDGVTLDGNGKTITMSGNVANYLKNVPDNWAVAAAVLANGGDAHVEDLTIKGGNLDANSGCSAPPEGLAFINTSGTIQRVTVEDIRVADDCGVTNGSSSGIGISATGTGGQTVDITDVTVRGSGHTGIAGVTRENSTGITVNIDGATVATDDEINNDPQFGGFNDSGIRLGSQINPGGTVNPSPVAGTITNTEITIAGGFVHGIDLFLGGGGTTVNVSDVTIDAEGAGSDGVGLNVAAFDESTIVNVNGLTFSANPAKSAWGIGMNGFGELRVSDSTILNATAGILVGGGRVTVENNTIETAQPGAIGVEFACFGFDISGEARNNTITGAPVGLRAHDALLEFEPEPCGAAVTADFTDNTIVGPSANADAAFGIFYGNGAISGAAAGNTISNYFDTEPAISSCGIGVRADTGEVTIEVNDFPDPPGNEEDVCLDIPVPMALHKAKKSGNPSGIEAMRHMGERKSFLAANDHADRDRRRSKQKNERGRTHQKRGGKH